MSLDAIRARDASRRYRARLRKVRNDVIAQDRDERARPSDKERAWAAGLFEGEGTVTINKAGRVGYTRARVSVTSTDGEIVAYFQERWPGSIRSVPAKKPAHKDTYCWTIASGEPLWRFLDDMLPFIVTTRVREKIKLVMADVEDRVQGSRDESYTKRRHERMATIRELNRRGRKNVVFIE